MIPCVNYVIYGCFSAITTPGVSLYPRLTPEKNIVAAITKTRWLMTIGKGKLKIELFVLVDYSY